MVSEITKRLDLKKYSMQLRSFCKKWMWIISRLCLKFDKLRGVHLRPLQCSGSESVLSNKCYEVCSSNLCSKVHPRRFWWRLPFIILVGDSLSGLGALAHELWDFHSRLGPQVYQQPRHVRVKLMIIETCSTAKVTWPVLPILWICSSISIGMSRPLAAMAVATRIGHVPCLKSYRASSHSSCRRSPRIPVDNFSSLESKVVIKSACFLMLMKIMVSSVGSRFLSFRIIIRVFFFSFFPTSRKVSFTYWQAPPNRPMVRKTGLQIFSCFSLDVLGESCREHKGFPHWLCRHVWIGHILVNFPSKPHVQHPVGLVEDKVLRVFKANAALLDEVQ